MMREKVQFAKDTILDGKYFFEDPTEYDEKVVSKKWQENTNEILLKISNSFKALPETASPEQYEENFISVCEENGVKPGSQMQPLRVAISGQGVGAPIWEMIAHLGRDYAVDRLNAATEKISFSNP
jgi:glutamyl-tRNA synthetase